MVTMMRSWIGKLFLRDAGINPLEYNPAEFLGSAPRCEPVVKKPSGITAAGCFCGPDELVGEYKYVRDLHIKNDCGDI